MAAPFDPYHRWLGIGPEEQPPDYYRLLGVRKFESEPDVIENAADQRMTHLRTLSTGPHAPHAQRLLNEISTARVCLLNPEKKAQYDQRLRAAAARPMPAPANATPVLPTAAPLPTKATAGPQVPHGPGSVPMGMPAQAAAPVRRPASKSQFPILLVVSGALLLLVLAVGGVAAGIAYFTSTGGESDGSIVHVDGDGADDGVVDGDEVDGDSDGNDAAPPTPPQPTPDDMNRVVQDIHPLTISLRGNVEPRTAAEATNFAAVLPSGLGGPGNWGRSSDGLALSVDVAGSVAPVLPLPVKPAGDYRLELSASVPSQHAGLALDLVVHGRPCRLVIDQPLAGRLYTGFAPAVEDSLAGHHSAPHLVAGERQIVCSVEGDQVLVTCDGVELFQWRGEPDALPVPTGPPEGKKVERAASSPPLVFPFALKLVRVYRIDAPPVPTPPTGPVDLLAAVDLSRDRAIGIASDNGDRLTIVGRTPTIVKLRRDVPVAFLLDLRLTRSNVTDPSVMIGILVGDRSGSLVIDSATSERQPASGLALIDGRRPNHETNATSVIGKRLLTDDQPSNVQVLVEGKRADGKCRVAASIDGVKFLDFLDDPARLTPFLQFDRFLRGEKCLWIGCWNSTVVFERIVLTPLDDASPDAVPLALREGQTPVDPGTVAGGPTTPERPALAAVPDAEALAAARKQVVDAFGRARTEAANREAKQSLVRQLIETAAAESDPVKDYALLDEALSVGIEIEDPALVLETVDARAARFEIEPWNQKGESLATILKSKSSLRRDLAVGAGLEVVEGALEAGEYEAAGELADDLLAAAVAAKQFALRKHIAALQQRIDAGRRLEAAANTARETLAANPDDAAACGVLGRWLCVGEGKWDEGLPLLAKSDDQTYRPLAEQELALADDADAEAQVKVAHAWWAMAENQTDATVKAALQSHAVERYRSVLPKIQSPLTRRTVEDRLKLYNLPTAAAGDGDEVILTPWLLRDALLVYTFERGTVVAGADKKWHVADLSGHAHHGTMEGGKQLRTIQGKAGLATFFEGRDDYILPSGLRARMVGLKQLTLAAWFNPAKTDGLTFLFDVGEGGRAARLFLQEGKLGFALPNVRGDARVDAPAPATGVWHHVAAVWDGGEQRLFLDGQLVASGPTTLAALDDTSLASEEAHWGAQARNFFRGDKCYVGVMDEMVVLPRALSEQEVRKLHRAGEAGVGLPALVEK